MNFVPNPGPSAPKPGPSTPTPPGGPKLSPVARLADCAAAWLRVGVALAALTVDLAKGGRP